MSAHKSDPRPRPPLVSLVVPVWNEERFISKALDAIDAQTYPADRIEIILVDGGSTDATVSIAAERASRDGRIKMLGGPGINTPAAMNIGIREARGEIVAKIDGHGEINPAFVEEAVTLLADTTIGCVGPLVVPLGETAVQRAISIARFSRLGVGGGVYTAPARLHAADTVQCGVYRREALEEAGGFDAALPYGEDEELNYRVRVAGWRILMSPKMRFAYHVRPSVIALAHQYFRYGRARVAVIIKHPAFFRVKHAAPLAVALGLPISLLSGLAYRPWLGVTGVLWGGYLGAVGIGGIVISVRRRFHRPDLVTASLIALHIGYGVGALAGILRWLRRQR